MASSFLEDWSGEIPGVPRETVDIDIFGPIRPRRVDIETFLVAKYREGQHIIPYLVRCLKLSDGHMDVLSVMFGLGYAEWNERLQSITINSDGPVKHRDDNYSIQLSAYDDDFIVGVASRKICNTIDVFVSNLMAMLHYPCRLNAYRMDGFEFVDWPDKYVGAYEPLLDRIHPYVQNNTPVVSDPNMLLIL